MHCSVSTSPPVYTLFLSLCSPPFITHTHTRTDTRTFFCIPACPAIPHSCVLASVSSSCRSMSSFSCHHPHHCRCLQIKLLPTHPHPHLQPRRQPQRLDFMLPPKRHTPIAKPLQRSRPAHQCRVVVAAGQRQHAQRSQQASADGRLRGSARRRRRRCVVAAAAREPHLVGQHATAAAVAAAATAGTKPERFQRLSLPTRKPADAARCGVLRQREHRVGVKLEFKAVRGVGPGWYKSVRQQQHAAEPGTVSARSISEESFSRNAVKGCCEAGVDAGHCAGVDVVWQALRGMHVWTLDGQRQGGRAGGQTGRQTGGWAGRQAARQAVRWTGQHA
eukprot:364453-Chlamydomonas_euryale.AAC.13